MIHPSYVELMKVVNNDVEIGEEPVVNSRYSLVIATAKRARQIIARQSGDNLDVPIVSKPLSQAISELNQGKIRILPEEEAAQLQEAAAGEAVQEQELAVQEEETQAQPE